jgi:hypothetical protein
LAAAFRGTRRFSLRSKSTPQYGKRSSSFVKDSGHSNISGGIVNARAMSIAIGMLAAWGVTSYGDAPQAGTTPVFPPTVPEPTTYPPVTPTPGDEQPGRDPFTPYAHGSLAPWAYEDLTAGEQAVVDRGFDTTSSVPVLTAFRTASIEQAVAAVAAAAGTALGVPDLSAIGVVP